MSAYVIVFVEKPIDHAEIEQYRREALPSLAGRNIKFLARPDCKVQTLEGDEVDVVVMIEFESTEAARDWYYSPAYQSAVKRRLATAKSRAVIVPKAAEPTPPTHLIR